MARILLIDDEPDLLWLAQMGLEQAGHAVETLTQPSKGVEVAREFGPDVIGLDWVTPELSGEEALRRLKEDPYTCSIPVVVVTALEGIDSHALLLGASAVVHKPFTISQLESQLESQLSRR